MLPFLLKRFGWFLVTCWAVITISFVLMRSVRGGPFDGERALSAEVERAIAARYHTDWPLSRQYFQYLGPFNLDEHGATFFGGDGTRPLGGILTGDLGPSFRSRDFSVNEIIAQSFPISLALGSVALCLAICVGLAAGLLSALCRGGKIDVIVRLLATIGIAVPNFVLATFLILFVAFRFDWAPVAGWGGFQHLILPGLALGAPFAATVARLTRTGLLDVLSEDYIRTAKAKGLSPGLVLVRHALPGALLPVVSTLGPAAAGILTGSLVIERIFGIPGTGSHFVNSALNRDYTLAMGVTILYTVLIFGLNTLVDLTYSLLDPRIELEES